MPDVPEGVEGEGIRNVVVRGMQKEAQVGGVVGRSCGARDARRTALPGVESGEGDQVAWGRAARGRQKEDTKVMKSAINYYLAHAVSWDVGNRHMKEAGRKVWNEDDWNAAAREFSQFWPEGKDENQNEDRGVEHGNALPGGGSSDACRDGMR